ncbi:SIR2 family protein [Enterobacter hormaechei]|uniref:SIR2 family protein n=1 Tax=Enterobacter hormaechei TaxID=158836 RepID=UPI00125318F2|nr:SIR2 family protein [Enterobacter hormaechei]VAF85051.1 Uncharacterised protein [Enterobacter hormaechei]
MIKWHNSLVDDLARRRCILFLGAGVSMNSVGNDGKIPPSWKEFLTHCLDSIDKPQQIRKLINNEDFLTACEIIRSKLQRGQFDSLLKEEFLAPKYIKAEIHEPLFKLDCRIVVTPNFDKIYETYVSKATEGTAIVKTYYDDDIASVIRENGRVILKIHGTIDNTKNLIFSRKDYAKARSSHRDFYEILNALSLTHTFLFIGCGINDPDIRLLLEDSFFKHNSTKPHYLVSSDKSINSELVPIIEETLNVNILTYKEIRKSHGELIKSINELLKLVEQKRLEIKQTMNW